MNDSTSSTSFPDTMSLSSAPFCAFEMYFFHPIDEPEVAIDVSGLFSTSTSSSSKKPSSAAVLLSSASDDDGDSAEDSSSTRLVRPIPTMMLPLAVQEAALSVVSSDEEDDHDHEDLDYEEDCDADECETLGDAQAEGASELVGCENDSYDRENRLNVSTSSKSWGSTTKRPVSELPRNDSIMNQDDDEPLQKKQRRVRIEGYNYDDEHDDVAIQGDEDRSTPAAPLQHDDAQQRARVLLWKQSLKRSLFQPAASSASP